MTTTSFVALRRGPASATGTVALHGADGSPERGAPSLDDLARGHGPHSELHGSM